MNEIIDTNFKITSILGKPSYNDYIISKLISQFKEKDVLLWQDKNLYFSTKRLQLCFGTNLISQLKWMIDDFEVLIISNFKDNVPCGIDDFLEYISSAPEMQNKQVILLFACTGVDRFYEVDLTDFPQTRNCIEKLSNNIYSFARDAEDNYICKNLKTNAKTFWEVCYDGLKSNLRIRRDE